MVAVTAAVCAAAPGEPAPPNWRLADGPVVPWTHETDLAARTVDPVQVAAENQASWGLPGYEFLPSARPAMDVPRGDHWWGEYRGAEIEHDQPHARAMLHAPGHRPLLGLLAHWIDRLFHPLRPAHRTPHCDTSLAMQYSTPESMPGEIWGEEPGSAASPFPQPLEPGLIPEAPLPAPLEEPTPSIPTAPARELPSPPLSVEPPPTTIEPQLSEPPLPEPHLPEPRRPEPAVPSNALPSGLQPSLQPVQPQFVDPMPMPEPEPMAEPNRVEPPPVAEPGELAPPTNVLPLERDTSAEPSQPSLESTPGRLGEEYPPVVELAPAPVLPDERVQPPKSTQPEPPPSFVPPPVLPPEPALPRNTVPRAPRLPKNSIPRSSR
jgi:hypothetical protein